MKLPVNILRHHHLRTGTSLIANQNLFQHLRPYSTSNSISKNDISNSKNSPLNHNKPGLFSLPSLHNPCDFLKLTQNAITTCDDIRNALTSTNSTTSATTTDPRKILHEFDRLSNSICTVIDAAELCRSVHTSPEWRAAAQKCFSLLSDYISSLNSDEGLYRALKDLVGDDDDDPSRVATFTEEEKRMAVLLLGEFERDGIHLPPREKKELMTVQNHIVTLESLFHENITTKRKYFDLPAGDVRAVIPAHVLDVVPQGGCTGEDVVRVSSENHFTNTLLKYSPSESVRKEVYMQSYTSCEDNLAVLDHLIDQRHQLALTLGFESYAERFLRDKMAQNQSNVYQFLHNLSGRLKGNLTKELELISHVKKQLEGNGEVRPWDVSFYTGLLQAQRHSLNTNDLVPYFSIDNCLRGMATLCRTLFDIQMTSAPLEDNELWCPRNTPGIYKYRFHHEEEGDIGTLFLDVHPRDHKYSHAAHFTVRCGCRKDFDAADYQTPIVALVCNLSQPQNVGGGDGSVALLSHSEVETLFHEFGHALHSLLSRTTFQHLSGTRTAIDYVEVPSHLFEHFVWDKDFLMGTPATAKDDEYEGLARHYATGETLDESVVDALIASRHSFQGLEYQTQVVYALLDQHLFGDVNKWRRHGNGAGATTTTELLASLHRQYGVPHGEGTFWHARFGHLVTYGAGYYGYLYSQVLAGDVWNALGGGAADGRKLTRESGEVIWKQMLRHGGAKDPADILRGVLGRDSSVDSFLVERKN
mmetsp:Transcript_38222/g.46633  ORF Transcript_38222/g.46633 Transcript_38222/m.46633 type:complete len:757 (-) Transcript_38222:59-2329(-)|eukprot:CAMPEP_0172513706 /NCGR_PEP_ID=MMETSP1066-20121228/254562_1 /TAXON_ID=671091 /ORGANISM="Coscinodiscus wailesii, Strain CCMP2513" /LENGTH=756 /DNA_ID=CAMNT_0013294087 /DNA_START=158 /DNA_END=2428 /DNA_ORIENTATION=+